MNLPNAFDKSTEMQKKELGDMAIRGMMEMNPIAAVFYKITQFILSLYSLTVEIFWRKQFGERYLAISTLLWALFVLWFCAFTASRISAPAFPTNRFNMPLFIFFSKPTILTWWFIIGYGLMAFWHRAVIFHRNWILGQEHHSYANGESYLERLFRPLQRKLYFIENIVPRFVEPLITIIIAAMIPDAYLRNWFMIAGITLMIKQKMIHDQSRAFYLNLIDQKVEAEATKLFMDGDSTAPAKPYHKGFAARVPVIPRKKALDG